MLPLPSNFRYLNRENRWLDFHWSGLVRSTDGALALLSSPKLIDPLPDLSGSAAPPTPSGIAVDRSGRIFYTVPDTNQVFAVGGCAPDLVELQCLSESPGLGPLREPRGLIVLHNPERLAIVDSGNHRLLFFDLVTFELRDVWGSDDVMVPQAGSLPGQFDTPWSVSADDDGNLYVLDYGNRRVQKFRPTGETDAGFSGAIEASSILPHPGALAVSGQGADVNVFVFDLDAKAIFVFDSTGTPRPNAEGEIVPISYPEMTQVLSLAASSSALYAGDNHLRQVLSFHVSAGFPFSGEAAGFEGPVAAISMDPAGGLVVLPGGVTQPLHMSTTGAYLPFGVLWSHGISNGKLPAAWNRLRTYVQNAAGAHIEFYYSTSDSPAVPPVDPSSPEPFGDSHWIGLPNDVDDFLLAPDKTQFLFVGAVFRSDQSSSVRLTQLRVDFDKPGYLPYLPVIYREPAPDADFLRRLLALFQGIFEDIEDEIGSLPRYFNPNSAPEEALAWLAGWLAVDLDQGEPVARIRAAIALAFRRYQWRGTAEGLRLALLQDAGVHANIVQPIAGASYWAFPGDTSCSGAPSTPGGVSLGETTTLPSVEPGGAVLGSTAELDHSYLITDSEFGEPLFDGTAYQFVVEVYRSEVNSKARLGRVQEIIEREKPAHTMWRLSALEPSMRVGFQARAGIDSVVAGTPGPSALGIEGEPGGLRLGGQPAPRVGASRLDGNLKLEW